MDVHGAGVGKAGRKLTFSLCNGFNTLGTQSDSLWKFFTSKDFNKRVLLTPSERYNS